MTEPTWTITGQFRSPETGRARGTILRYWDPDAAYGARKLVPLEGDAELVALLQYDAASGRLVAATPTSEQTPAALEDSASMFLAALTYFEPGYTVAGHPGVTVPDLPAGAQA